MTKGPEQGRITYPASPHPLCTRDHKQLFTPCLDRMELEAELDLGML